MTIFMHACDVFMNMLVKVSFSCRLNLCIDIYTYTKMLFFFFFFRAKYHKLKFGTELNQELRPPHFEKKEGEKVQKDKYLIVHSGWTMIGDANYIVEIQYKTKSSHDWW